MIKIYARRNARRFIRNEINNLFFETAKYDLKSESFSELNRVAEILKRAKMEGLSLELIQKIRLLSAEQLEECL